MIAQTSHRAALPFSCHVNGTAGRHETEYRGPMVARISEESDAATMRKRLEKCRLEALKAFDGLPKPVLLQCGSGNRSFRSRSRVDLGTAKDFLSRRGFRFGKVRYFVSYDSPRGFRRKDLGKFPGECHFE
jgi:hypothetical protein